MAIEIGKLFDPEPAAPEQVVIESAQPVAVPVGDDVAGLGRAIERFVHHARPRVRLQIHRGRDERVHARCGALELGAMRIAERVDEAVAELMDEQPRHSRVVVRVPR